MTTYRKDDPETIQALFDSIAERYDTTNAVLSLGLHRWWNRRLVDAVFAEAATGPLLDLCCGTGQIAWTYLARGGEPREVHLIDFCAGMLAKAKRRAEALHLGEKHRLHFTQGDAMAIPLPDASVAAATVAYGIRNVNSPKQCLSELKRVLVPGGRVGILELTRPNHPLLRWGHSFYLRRLLPLLGRLCTSNYAAYSYLSTSIDQFTEPEALRQAMEEAGFTQTAAIPLLGGIAHLLLGTNNPDAPNRHT